MSNKHDLWILNLEIKLKEELPENLKSDEWNILSHVSSA